MVALLERRASCRRPRRAVYDKATVPSAKAQSTPAGALDLEAALVHQAVVVGAELHKVVELCRSSSSPVLDVVRMQEPPVSTAWESAPAVPDSERST